MMVSEEPPTSRGVKSGVSRASALFPPDDDESQRARDDCEDDDIEVLERSSSIEVIEEDARPGLPGEFPRSTGVRSDMSGADASNAGSRDRGVSSESWAAAGLVPEAGNSGQSTRCDQRCDAMREHRLGRESTPAKSCAVSLLIYGETGPKKQGEGPGKFGTRDADAFYELEDEDSAGSDSRVIEGARSSASSGCPN